MIGIMVVITYEISWSWNPGNLIDNKIYESKLYSIYGDIENAYIIRVIHKKGARHKIQRPATELHFQNADIIRAYWSSSEDCVCFMLMGDTLRGIDGLEVVVINQNHINATVQGNKYEKMVGIECDYKKDFSVLARTNGEVFVIALCPYPDHNRILRTEVFKCCDPDLSTKVVGCFNEWVRLETELEAQRQVEN